MPDDETITEQRVRNRWGEGDRLRFEILEGAGRLLSELGGEDGLTIRGVAREVGIAPASIYQHFADRAALIEGLVDYEFGLLVKAMAAADESLEPGDVMGRLRAQVHAHRDFADAKPGHYRLLFGKATRRAISGERPVSGPLVEVFTSLITAFERCADAGHVLRLPSRRAASLVFVSVYGRAALLDGVQPAHPSEDFLDDLVSLVFA
ncbi:TetR/AcrR family transcriptional regulator [Kribbella sp. CA-293567]|uniref:TetR/AcrR family transcriptional regulator n=1 Tax=Kribbella sp. CA-293567 TaxID=3002436 RepID=UPI0022DD09B5|nr:TetR/AcrR family transcriptional regulator [Kribbella sp. CA-293567]WBQ02130.1 TetR/AcrR family transcriptional regulator [Kribbella sp. CA-293567]